MSNELTAQPKTTLAVGTRGIEIRDFDGLWRVSSAIAKSGLAPKGIQTTEGIFVAIQMGLEVGMSPMASLQNIAVINGRPSIWGDAQLAIVRQTGDLEEFTEWYEDAGKRLPRNPVAFGDTTTAVCRVKRRGYEATETGFSVADAKAAGLWGKDGPWRQYPARMLRNRARSFALRDSFGDALKGLRATEEVQDDPATTAVNVTPIFRAPAETVAPALVEPAAPTEAPTPAPAPEAPAKTPQETLADIVTGAGHTFDRLKAWAVDAGYKIADAGSFDEIPNSVADRFARNREKLLAGLAA